MTFIKLNHANGPVFINLDNVRYIDDDNDGGGARIWYDELDFIYVVETLHDVMDVVKRVQKDWPK